MGALQKTCLEEWEDIRTSPDVAREEANDMMATGRGEIYEVVPLYTTPQPTQAVQPAGWEPLTEQQIKDGAERSHIHIRQMRAFVIGARFAERHHGINKGGQHGAE